jgi:Cu(I)/Ag(I) efflux system membrane fusion protein
VAHLVSDLGEKLAIPEAAAMRDGHRAYAFRDAGDGRLVPTPVKLGARADGWFELLDGLGEGDKVVTSANFLVDSESSMKAAMEAVGGP